MIDAIKIIIDNGVLSQISDYFIYQDRICYINNKKKLIVDVFFKKLMDIIYVPKNREDVYYSNGLFLTIYILFGNLLGDVYGR